MTPFHIERRVLGYLEDFDNVPLIHRMINESISRICNANMPGQDWSFLSFTETVTINPVTGVGTLAHYPRAIIDVTPTDTYALDWDAKTITHTGTGTRPATVFVKYYRRHPFLTTGALTESDLTAYDTTWTATEPPESLLVIPKEMRELIVYGALDLLYEHEIEVAVNRQTILERFKSGIEAARANYCLQIYPSLQPANPTAEYFVTHACIKTNGERNRAKWLNALNTIATEIADAAKMSLTDRASVTLVTEYTDTLPTFKSKAAPTDLWYKGMMFYAAMSGLGDAKDAQVITSQYQAALANFKELFYGQTVATSYNLDTYGSVVEFLRSIWQTYRAEGQLWTVVNEAIADVMRKVDLEDLATTYSVTATGLSEYVMPTRCKRILWVTVDGNRIPGKAAQDLDAQVYHNVAGAGYSQGEQSFFFQGRSLVFAVAPSTGDAIKVRYYPSHTYTADPAAAMPFDAMLIIPYMQAYIALYNKDFASYKLLSSKYVENIMQHFENQENAAPMDTHISVSTPSIDRLLSNFA